MDNEALKIFWGYFESYYNDTFYTLEEMFANTFTDTANRIMSHPTNGYDTMIVLIIAAGIAIVIIGIVMVVRKGRIHPSDFRNPVRKIRHGYFRAGEKISRSITPQGG